MLVAFQSGISGLQQFESGDVEFERAASGPVDPQQTGIAILIFARKLGRRTDRFEHEHVRARGKLKRHRRVVIDQRESSGRVRDGTSDCVAAACREHGDLDVGQRIVVRFQSACGSAGNDRRSATGNEQKRYEHAAR